MFLTSEVRWFDWGTVPRAVLNWLGQRSSLPELQPPRQDHYLDLAGDGSLSIKLREGRVEVKMRLQQRGIAHFGEKIAGRVQRWQKWSFPLLAPEVDPGGWLTPARSWIPVHKARRLHRYGMAGDGTVTLLPLDRMPRAGCDFELSEVRTGGDTWWSLCFEAYGPAASLEDSLYAVAAVILGPAWPVTMEAERSQSYPEWLAMVRGEGPRP